MPDLFSIDTIEVNEEGISVFSETDYPKEIRGGMHLTPRIDALNLRLRTSEPGYKTDWHLAGDPTLIIIQQGTLRIGLQNGETRDYKAGDAFIAKDQLPEAITFDPQKHGHRAEVIGHEVLKAVHIKLSE